MIGVKRALLCGYDKDCASALRGPGARMLVAEYVPFCALQACLEDQASHDRFVFTVGHGVLVSGLQVRRLLRTGEFDEKLAKLHHVSLGVALNVFSQKTSGLYNWQG